jgi:hypothetical protein
MLEHIFYLDVYTVMVNNSTNINKMNYHLSPSLTEHNRRPQHMTLEIHALAWDRHKNVKGWNRLIGSKPSLKNTFFFVTSNFLMNLHRCSICLYRSIETESSVDWNSQLLKIPWNISKLLMNRNDCHQSSCMLVLVWTAYRSVTLD